MLVVVLRLLELSLNQLLDVLVHSVGLWAEGESSLWAGVLFFSRSLNVQQHLIPFLVSAYCGNRVLRCMGLSRHSKL